MSIALVADSNVKVSKDCRNWKIGENKDFQQAGYLQSEESDIVYFDFSKNLWIQMGKKYTLAFFEHNGNGLTIVDPYANNADNASIDSFFLGGKHIDTLVDLIKTLANQATKMASENHWSLRGF